MAIPVLAAVLIGGSIAPAFADHQNNAECDAKVKQLIKALISGNDGRINGAIHAFVNACNFGVGSECEAFADNFFAALDRGNIDQAIKQLENFVGHDC